MHAERVKLATLATVFMLSCGALHADQVRDALDVASHALANPSVWSALDTSIDRALAAAGLATHDVTRVVPIIGYGGGTAALRFAQVAGPQAAVARVKAIMEVDNATSTGPWQFTALIPVSSVDRNGRGRRVDGVGVTALVTH